MSEDVFNGIPEDRRDEWCSNGCTRNHLIGIMGAVRKVGDRFYQSLWNCSTCGNLVVQLDELATEDCPTCGCECSFKLSTILEMEREKQDELKPILDWFKEYDPCGEESFYQEDRVELALGELGIACYRVLTKLGIYKPKDY